jgi:hypothetical protein
MADFPRWLWPLSPADLTWYSVSYWADVNATTAATFEELHIPARLEYGTL